MVRVFIDKDENVHSGPRRRSSRIAGILETAFDIAADRCMDEQSNPWGGEYEANRVAITPLDLAILEEFSPSKKEFI